MTHETVYKIKVFVSAFFISLAVFGGMFALSYFFLSFDSAPANDTVSGVPIQGQYTPDSQDSLSLVLIGCKEYTLAPSFIFLMKFNAVTQQCNLVELPINTLSSADGKEETLSYYYKYGGAEMVTKASENLFSLSGSQYLRIDYEGLKTIVDYFSGLVYSVAEEISTEEYHFQSGKQLLDGKRFASLMFSSGYLDKADLMNCFLTEYFQVQMIEKLDRFYNTLFDVSDTSLSRMLFNQLDKPIQAFLRNEKPKFFAHQLSGKMTENGLSPSSEDITKLSGLFSDQQIT